jgi:hypothetical protein
MPPKKVTIKEYTGPTEIDPASGKTIRPGWKVAVGHAAVLQAIADEGTNAVITKIALAEGKNPNTKTVRAAIKKRISKPQVAPL